jgi:excisionase family DNA binding protein
MAPEHGSVMTVTDAAEALGISRTHAYGLVAGGELPAFRLGRKILVPRRGVELLLHGRGPVQGPLEGSGGPPPVESSTDRR